MWTFTRRSVTSHSIWPLIYKHHFRFKKCFNIASTTNEHFYLKYHSVGYLTMYYVLLKGSNSLFTCNADIPRLFVIWISFTNVFTLKGWSTSYFRRLDCVCGGTVTCVSVLLRRSVDFLVLWSPSLRNTQWAQRACLHLVTSCVFSDRISIWFVKTFPFTLAT